MQPVWVLGYKSYLISGEENISGKEPLCSGYSWEDGEIGVLEDVCGTGKLFSLEKVSKFMEFWKICNWSLWRIWGCVIGVCEECVIGIYLGNPLLKISGVVE